ncbi:hypothetical protein CPB86DRAFT_782844 [Serendipita vermifera]|nr:hypothetical protein CPB86DRAFT_782844 [Serendipita vermifera]
MATERDITKLSGALDMFLSRQKYVDVQISDGEGGHALEEANNILTAPFDSTNMVDIPYHVYEHLANLWEAIEYAGIMAFPNAIEKAHAAGNKDLADALLVGKAKNDVLLSLAEVQLSRIKNIKDEYEGRDVEDLEFGLNRLELLEQDLMVAVEQDRANAGLTSRSVRVPSPL